MQRLRLKHSSTPARLYGMNNWNEFSRSGEVRLKFSYNGQRMDFIIGYTKPYKNIEQGIFANILNLNQNRLTSTDRKRDFQVMENIY